MMAVILYKRCMNSNPARRSPKSKSSSNTVAQNAAASLLAAGPGKAWCVECDGQGDSSRPGKPAGKQAWGWSCVECHGTGMKAIPAGSFQRFA